MPPPRQRISGNDDSKPQAIWDREVETREQVAHTC